MERISDYLCRGGLDGSVLVAGLIGRVFGFERV